MVTTTSYHTCMEATLHYCVPEIQPACMVTRSVIAIGTEMGMFIIHGRVCCGKVNTVIISEIMRIGVIRST